MKMHVQRSAIAAITLCALTITSEPDARAEVAPPAKEQAAMFAADIDRRLRSGDPRQVAWAAQAAAQFAMTDTIEPLSIALVTTPAANEWVLDALIQLHAVLPASHLLSAYDEWPVQALILFGDASLDREQVLEQLFDRAFDDRWFAIANLLVESKSTELTRILLRDLRLAVHVSIVDNAMGLGGGSGGGSGCGIYVGGAGYDRSYPPPVTYEFSAGRRGATILARGPHPVYYTRRVGRRSPAGRVSSGPGAGDRVTYLAALAGFDDRDMPIRASTHLSIEWAGQEAFERTLAAQRDDLAIRYGWLLKRLVARQHLAAADAERLRPAIDVEVTDRRRTR